MALLRVAESQPACGGDCQAGGRDRLEVHVDGSEVSFTVLLSDPATFTGGGTFFEGAEPLEAPAQPAVHAGEEGAAVKPGRGQMVSHFGRLRHAGLPVLNGTRYILAGFVRVRTLAQEHWRRLRGPGPDSERLNSEN